MKYVVVGRNEQSTLVQMDEEDLVSTKEFTYDEAEDKRVMLKNGSWVTTKSSFVNPDNPCERVETRLDREGGQINKTLKIFRAFPWGQEIVKVIKDPDGKALVTTFAYFEEKKGPHYSFLKSSTYPDGTVELHNEQPDPTMPPAVRLPPRVFSLFREREKGGEVRCGGPYSSVRQGPARR